MKRLLFVALAVIPFLVSCPTENPFAELEGVNLLSEEEQAFTGWEIDYGDDDVTFDYMTFEASTEVGPDTGDTVYRMEIVNLVPNGDFENALSAAWSTEGGATADSETYSRLDYVIQQPANDRINFDLDVDIADGLVTNASYIFRFLLKSVGSGTSYFEYKDPLEPWELTINDETLSYNFPADFIDITDATFTPNETRNIFTIGTIQDGGAMEGYIDNLRIARTDITSCVVLDVPVSSAGRSDLPSGTYRLTVYVKEDPDVTPTTDNRMPATALCLAVTSAEGASISSFTPAAYQATATWSDWTACSVTGVIQVDKDATTALRLRVSPTDTLSGSYGRDVGSLLISSPVLEYSADGSF